MGWAALLCLGSGCFYTSPPRRGQPYDAVIVPGCPSATDGSLSLCQKQRAAWASLVFERGLAQALITSGAAVYSPYIEADALALALARLGVPGERIYLDRQALHTDENMHNAAELARQLGAQHVAVASHGMQAKGGCSMVTARGLLCTPLPLEDTAVQARLSAQASTLAEVRSPRQEPWQPLAEVEAQRRRATGKRRLPSSLLYGWMWLRRSLGRDTRPDWIPPPASPVTALRFSDVYSDKRR